MLNRIASGDSLTFSTSLPDYPASAGWTLRFRLVPVATGTPIEFSTTANGDAHQTTVAASTTSNWTAGAYNWAAWVERSGEVYTVETGRTEVLSNPRTVTTGFDTRTHAQQRLDDLQAAYTAHLSRGHAAVAEYEIAGRRMKFDLATLIKAIESAKRDVIAEQAAARVGKGLSARVRYVTRM